jgi:hypothetical protein
LTNAVVRQCRRKPPIVTPAPRWDHELADTQPKSNANGRSPMEAHLSGHHRDTIERIFSHTSSHNIEWRQVVSLLEAIGTVTQEHNGKLKVALGPETEVLPAPHGKDVDAQIVVDLRRMLKQAGFAPKGSPAVSDQRARDHGDGQWGRPT